MKKIITAIGNKELNNLLKQKTNIIIKSTDIQYQEGIFEALEKYPNIDTIILKEDIIGDMKLEELIRNIVLIKNNIQIILITNEEKTFSQNKNIIKIVKNKKDYVKDIEKYILSKIDINNKNGTKSINKVKEENFEYTEKLEDNVKKQCHKYKERKTKIDSSKKVIMFIGNSGVRKNNSYFYIVKIN